MRSQFLLAGLVLATVGGPLAAQPPRELQGKVFHLGENGQEVLERDFREPRRCGGCRPSATTKAFSPAHPESFHGRRNDPARTSRRRLADPLSARRRGADPADPRKELIRIELLPVGSKLFWTNDRIEKFVQDEIRRSAQLAVHKRERPAGNPPPKAVRKSISGAPSAIGRKPTVSARTKPGPRSTAGSPRSGSGRVKTSGRRAYRNSPSSGSAKRPTHFRPGGAGPRRPPRTNKAGKGKAARGGEGAAPRRGSGRPAARRVGALQRLAFRRRDRRLSARPGLPPARRRGSAGLGGDRGQPGPGARGARDPHHRRRARSSCSATARAFELALEVRVREKLPLEWAATQQNLGIVLQWRGRRVAGEQALKLLGEAATACRRALEVENARQTAAEWASTQVNPGAPSPSWASAPRAKPRPVC